VGRIEVVGSLPKSRRFRSGLLVMRLAPYSLFFPLQEHLEKQGYSRVAFIFWTSALGKILTLANLKKRHVIVMDWCCMYKKSEESINHLMLHCEVARNL
jgi:hypothetical protein